MTHEDGIWEAGEIMIAHLTKEIDYKKVFYSADKALLKSRLKKKIKDLEFDYEIIYNILDSLGLLDQNGGK